MIPEIVISGFMLWFVASLMLWMVLVFVDNCGLTVFVYKLSFYLLFAYTDRYR